MNLAKFTLCLLLALWAVPARADCIMADPIGIFSKGAKEQVKKALRGVPQTLVVETYTAILPGKEKKLEDTIIELAKKRALRYNHAVIVIIAKEQNLIVVVSSEEDDRSGEQARTVLNVMTAYFMDKEHDEALRAAEKLIFWRTGSAD